MKLIFAHDEKLINHENKYYSTTNLVDVIMNRYLKYYDEVVLLVRVIENKSFDVSKGKVIDDSRVKVVSIPDPYKLSLNNYKKVTKILEEQILMGDVLLARLPSMVGSIATKVARKKGKKHIVEVVGCAFDSLWNHGSLKGKLMAPIMYIITKSGVKSADSVLYVTNQFLQMRYPTRGKSIGCSDVEIVLSEDVIDKRIKTSIDKKNVKIGMIGTLSTRYKGHETAFKAMKILMNKGYNVKLNLVGFGELKEWKATIEELGIENHIEFLGTKSSGDEIFNFLDSIDVYIQPSLTEGMPRATIEAMSRGCPTVTTGVGGLKEITDTEFIINKKDYKELANKIEKLILNDECFKRQVRRNFRKSYEYNSEILKEKQEGFYKFSV